MSTCLLPAAYLGRLETAHSGDEAMVAYITESRAALTAATTRAPMPRLEVA